MEPLKEAAQTPELMADVEHRQDAPQESVPGALRPSSGEEGRRARERRRKIVRGVRQGVARPRRPRGRGRRGAGAQAAPGAGRRRDGGARRPRRRHRGDGRRARQGPLRRLRPGVRHRRASAPRARGRRGGRAGRRRNRSAARAAARRADALRGPGEAERGLLGAPTDGGATGTGEGGRGPGSRRALSRPRAGGGRLAPEPAAGPRRVRGAHALRGALLRCVRREGRDGAGPRRARRAGRRGCLT